MGKKLIQMAHVTINAKLYHKKLPIKDHKVKIKIVRRRLTSVKQVLDYKLYLNPRKKVIKALSPPNQKN